MEDPVFGAKLRKTGTRVPVVLSQGEVPRLLEKLEEAEKPKKSGNSENGEKREARYGLAARLQYGTGLRLSKLVRLRVKDIDLDRGTVTVRRGKGDKDCLGCRLPAPSPCGLLLAG